MKRILFLWVLAHFSVVMTFSQEPLKKLTKEFEYTMVSFEGTNASAVVWHPGLNLYFTLIAGNSEFPFEAFDAAGKSAYSQPVQMDSRGMWYNPKKKRLEINGAGELGWAAIILKKDMTAHSIKEICAGQYQPDFQSVGTFNPDKSCVVFLNSDEGSLNLYGYKSHKFKKSIPLTFVTGSITDYSSTSVGYTGYKGYEYVLLNVEEGQLVFFNEEGKATAISHLPDDAVLNPSFRFSYTNGRVFLYDVDERVWSAYKVF